MSRRGLPPLATIRLCPTCSRCLSRAEQRLVKLTSLWGEVEQPRTRYRCVRCGYSLSAFDDESLDESGCLPEVLNRLRATVLEASYRSAETTLERWGVKLGKSRLARLGLALERTEVDQGGRVLDGLGGLPLIEQRADGRGRTWMIEIDGAFVPTVPSLPGRPPDEPRGQTSEPGHELEYQAGRVRWREVKTAVLYPLHSPSERYRVCWLGSADQFGLRVHGLLRWAGLTQQDRLIGVSDGAAWISELMDDLGVRRHILDVFHASLYLERLMCGLGWDEASRSTTRRALMRGEVDVQPWLNRHTGGTVRQGLDEDSLKALSYLEKQAEMEHTAYPRFRAEGLCIGSGQVEGSNKAVLRTRLCVSGARWSETGARSKAFARGESYSRRALCNFDDLRHATFPRAA